MFIYLYENPYIVQCHEIYFVVDIVLYTITLLSFLKSLDSPTTFNITDIIGFPIPDTYNFKTSPSFVVRDVKKNSTTLPPIS